VTSSSLWYLNVSVRGQSEGTAVVVVVVVVTGADVVVVVVEAMVDVELGVRGSVEGATMVLVVGLGGAVVAGVVAGIVTVVAEVAMAVVVMKRFEVGPAVLLKASESDVEAEMVLVTLGLGRDVSVAMVGLGVVAGLVLAVVAGTVDGWVAGVVASCSCTL
jgi:hypothetical protein